MIGNVLSQRYKIMSHLGSGGFGQTYLAEDTQIPGNPVCVVKHLKPLSTSPEQLAKAKMLFDQEARKLFQLGTHDQIPELLAYPSDGDDLFLVQQYIEGHTLDTELQPGQVWSEQQVIQFLLDLLPVLDFIHKAGTIHRDIKPPNIIRRKRDNKPVLIDFGAVKEVQAQVGSTVQPTVATGTVIGTRGYMSSEQGQGKPRPSSDLYALGIICIQALTGKMPNQLDDDVDTGELVWKHLVQASPGLKQVLEKMTRYHFRERYQSAAEALQAVQSLTSANYQQTIDATKWVNPDPIPTPNPIPPPPPNPIPPNLIPPDPAPQPDPPSPKPSNPHRGYWILASVIAGLFAGLLRFIFSNSSPPDPLTSTSSGDCNVVVFDSVNIRDDIDNRIGMQLKKGMKINVIGDDGQRVKFDGVQGPNGSVSGWVYKEQDGKAIISNNCTEAIEPQPKAEMTAIEPSPPPSSQPPSSLPQEIPSQSTLPSESPTPQSSFPTEYICEEKLNGNVINRSSKPTKDSEEPEHKIETSQGYGIRSVTCTLNVNE
jgi:serine/threonine protein kinase, bacterial